MCNNLKYKFCGSNRINKRDKQRYLCREARSQTMMCLHNHCSLSFGEVPKRLKGARSTKWEQIKLA